MLDWLVNHYQRLALARYATLAALGVLWLAVCAVVFLITFVWVQQL